MKRLLSSRLRKRLAAAVVIGSAALLLGLVLRDLNVGQGLRRASYDLPFLFGEHVPPADIVLVHLDESSHRDLDQPLAMPWDRRLHAKLVDHLKNAGARIIVFDILFHDEVPGQDDEFAMALKNHGKVILAGELIRTESAGAAEERLLLPSPLLRRAAAGWGLADTPVDTDGVVRRVRHLMPTPFGDKPGLAEAVRKLDAGSASAPPDEAAFLNHYGPAGRFTGFNYADVLLERGVPANAFKNRIVVIGARQKAGLTDAGKDTFPTPYTRGSLSLTPGMEIQATAMGNLLSGRAIRPLARNEQSLFIGVCAALLAVAACLLPPVRGISLTVLIAVVIGMAGIVFHQREGVLWFWTIPVFGQMPFVIACSLGAHYLIEYSARWRLRRAFKSYMSDEQARRIDEEAVSLELGGKEVEATIFFSDLAGFTSMSEGLPPQALSNALISYFERATEGILDNNGTIIKYIGDAVIATWGVPVVSDREADRAIAAAIQMQVAGSGPVSLESGTGRIEKVLETRIGIHTGTVLAGNLGSRRRFDYTVIGDAVNVAARLEGLNKMLGTSVLVSESVLARCVEPERFVTRKMGSFVLMGKKLGIVVFEVLGYREDRASVFRERRQDYLDFYQTGLDACLAGNYAKAIDCFSQSLMLHDRLPECPASRLQLDAIEAHRSSVGEWCGEIVLDSK